MIHKWLRDTFFQHGWLLPAVLVLTQLGGRGLYNTLAGFYALWGLLSLCGCRHRLDRLTTLLYLALLAVFLVGIPGAMHPKEGLRAWLGFLAPSLAILLVQAALWESSNTLDRLLGGIALFGGVTLLGLYLLLLYHGLGLSGRPFDPSTQLREDELPFLLPFLLAWIWWRDTGAWRYWSMAGVVVAVLTYVVIAEGRAALLGVILALAVFAKLVLAWRWRWIAALATLVLIVAIGIHSGPFRKVDLDPEQPLDAFTAGRTALWRQALEHPPKRLWLGVGLGNGRYATEILHFELGGVHTQVQHLHNFLMDVWYETGILGAGSLLALIGAVFWRLSQRWRLLSVRDRQRAGVLLAAALAILGAALFSFSYTSRHFAYLFVCFGALIYLSNPVIGAKHQDR